MPETKPEPVIPQCITDTAERIAIRPKAFEEIAKGNVGDGEAVFMGGEIHVARREDNGVVMLDEGPDLWNK